MNYNHTSTISRESKRNSYKKSINYSVIGYSPISAQKKYNERRKDTFKRLAKTSRKFNIEKTIKKRPKEDYK